MATEPERKLVKATYRCLDEEGFLFPGKMEYVRHVVNLPGGATTHTEWKQNQSRANCPNDATHDIDLHSIDEPV